MRLVLTLLLGACIVLHNAIVQYLLAPHLSVSFLSSATFLLLRELVDFLCLAALFRLRSPAPAYVWKRLPVWSSFLPIACFVVASLLALLAWTRDIPFLNTWFFIDADTHQTLRPEASSPLALFYLGLSASLLAPLREELFFRSFLMQDPLKASRGDVLMLSTLLFAFSHFPSFSPREILCLGLGGLALGFCYRRYGFALTYVSHVFWNVLVLGSPTWTAALQNLRADSQLAFLLLSFAGAVVFFRGLGLTLHAGLKTLARRHAP